MRAIPVRGNHPWTMLLCKLANNNWEPQSRAFFQQWLTDSATDGTIANYFSTVSNGQYTIHGSKVIGWYSLPYTLSQVRLLMFLSLHVSLSGLYPGQY